MEAKEEKGKGEEDRRHESLIKQTEVNTGSLVSVGQGDLICHKQDLTERSIFSKWGGVVNKISKQPTELYGNTEIRSNQKVAYDIRKAIR